MHFTQIAVQSCCEEMEAQHLFLIFLRLVSYIPRTRTIHIDSSKVTYVAAEKDVKIRVEASTTANGVRHHSPVVSKSVSKL